jgi:2-phospho-L-lactate guanylyltransferase
MFTAVIPVKEFRSAKQRLSGVLRPKEREDFAAAMLRDVLELAAKATSVSDVVVVTVDAAAQQLAKAHGARIFEETTAAGLNAALDEAAARLAAEGAPRLMILPTDVVSAAPDDLTMLANAHMSGAGGLTIAAARADFGTNCLLVNPPDLLPFCFGKLSSIRHLELAKRRGHPARILLVPRLDRDIDYVDDLRTFCAAAPDRHSWTCLAQNGALQRILSRCAGDDGGRG